MLQNVERYKEYGSKNDDLDKIEGVVKTVLQVGKFGKLVTIEHL